MIFYLAIEPSGRKVLCGTQVDAKRIDKDFEQIDVPVDKKGLMEFVQESLNMLFEMGQAQPAASTPVEPKLIITGEPTGAAFSDRFDDAREQDRAEVMGVSRDVLLMSDKIGTMDGWPLGQMAAAVTSRIAELSKPYVETPQAEELQEEIDEAAQCDEDLLEIADDAHRAKLDDGDED